MVVDRERHWLRVGGEGLEAALAQVALADPPFEALSQGAEILNDRPTRADTGQGFIGSKRLHANHFGQLQSWYLMVLMYARAAASPAA
jgi:hypothetical protein